MPCSLSLALFFSRGNFNRPCLLIFFTLIIAVRSAKGGKPKREGGRQQKEGRPQRGRQFDRHSGTGIV